jgi:tetratricopeptide (TPR) repeat protein
LVAGTLVLVLFVLPQRYVLSSGFRESGISFPTPATPFVPVPVVRMAARDLPQPPPVVAPGPAEIFWAEVTPLLDEGRFDEALPTFRSYLREHPGDADARREYAIALLAAGRAGEAVPELRRLLSDEENLERRLLLARTLRELGQIGEASEEYAALVEADPGDAALWLEWAQLHAWAEEYDAAAEVLASALTRHPDSVPLRVEAARVELSRDRPEAASEHLAGLDEAALAAEDGIALRDAIVAALFVPDEVAEPTPPPTLLEQAVAAREEGDFDQALDLLGEALRENPDEIELWQAYADLLEYELDDLEGARLALLEVERLGEPDAGLQYRLAQLEIWTSRNPEARARLLALLPVLESDPVAASEVSTADVHAMLGDLYRWDGDRIAAAGRYRLALDDDPANQRALDGFSALEGEVARTLVEVEEPRAGASTYGLADTDDFTRLDVAAEWVEVGEDWVWGGEAGNRWLDGLALDGTPTEVQQGIYADFEAARWWRWGTLRSAAKFGVQRVRDVWDYSIGGSLAHRGMGGVQTELSYEHGPAYPTTATLQSALVGVVQDHVTVVHSRPLNERWNVSATVEGAWLNTDLDSIPTAQNERTTRFGSALTLGREMSESLTLGLTTRAVGYSSSGPVTTDSVTSVERRLFWDPRLALSTGPFARISHDLSASWTITGTLGPGIAFIDERTSTGWDVVPHVSAEAGLRREGTRFWTALDFFFYQGQFDGYRMYGARLTFSARDFARLAGAR